MKPFAISIFALLVGQASAALIIYESFDDSDATLNGNASGTGLSGNWSSEGGNNITSGSLSWGSLATSGNQVINVGGNFQEASVSTGTTLTSGGHLNNGAVLWFSFLAQSVSSGRTYMTIGTGGPDGFDRIGGGGGMGLGVRLENGNVHAHGWDGSAQKPAGTAVSNGTVFVVGRITWSADDLTNDTLEIFLPGTDLVLPGSAASTLSHNFTQAGQLGFTTLGFAGSTPPIPNVDEIRFGTSYLDVAPVPEPSTALLTCLAVFGLLRRRR